MVEEQEHRSVAHVVVPRLLLQIHELEVNRAAWCNGQSGKNLHDFRVAVRRSRALLGQFKNYLPKTGKISRELAWLGEISGPLRDLDVQLQLLAAPQELFCHCDRGVTAAVSQLLVAEREELVQKLRLQLLTEPAVSFAERCSLRLQGWPQVEKSSAPAEIVSQRIDKLLRQLLEDGAELSCTSTDEQFHRQRILGKKLRYLLEFFADFYPPELAAGLIAELKQLQDILGLFQDCSVWLQRSRAGLQPEHAGQLVELCTQQQQRCRQQFSSVFTAFSDSLACRRLQGLLKA